MRAYILLLLFIVSSSAQGQAAFTLASDVWPPFTNQTGEKVVALDIVKNTLNRDEQPVQFAIAGFDEVMSQIQAATVHGSAVLWYTEERAEYLAYSDPYLQNQPIFAARKGTALGFATFNEMNGKKIGRLKIRPTPIHQAPQPMQTSSMRGAIRKISKAYFPAKSTIFS
jgi:polar amino acid transport system substrate-binding protein